MSHTARVDTMDSVEREVHHLLVKMISPIKAPREATLGEVNAE